MTLNGVMAVILCYFSKLGSFGRELHKVVEAFCDRNVAQSVYLLAIYHLR